MSYWITTIPCWLYRVGGGGLQQYHNINLSRWLYLIFMHLLRVQVPVDSRWNSTNPSRLIPSKWWKRSILSKWSSFSSLFFYDKTLRVLSMTYYHVKLKTTVCLIKVYTNKDLLICGLIYTPNCKWHPVRVVIDCHYCIHPHILYLLVILFLISLLQLTMLQWLLSCPS